jgi:Flp pilus assembly protein TadB
MSTILIGLVFCFGLWLAWRSLVVKKMESEKREALVRLQAMMENSGERIAREKKGKREGPSLVGRSLSGMMNRIAGRISTSPKFAGEEGTDLISFIQKELTLAGLYPRISPQQGIAIILMCWGGAAVMGLLAAIGAFPSFIAILGGVLLLLYPFLKHRGLKSARREAIRSEVPFFLQELTMALATGALVLDTAIARVAEDSHVIGTQSIIADEFRRAVSEYQRGGLRREDAIRGVAERSGVQEVHNLVEAILTGAEMGTEGLVDTLEQYGIQAREMWRNSIREFINKREPLITLSLVITMFGGLILYAAPLIIKALGSLSSV